MRRRAGGGSFKGRILEGVAAASLTSASAGLCGAWEEAGCWEEGRWSWQQQQRIKDIAQDRFWSEL